MNKLFAIFLTAILTGCASVDICRKEKTMVNIENTGWYLFNLIPVASGDPENPNGHTCKLFSDTVTLESNMKLLDYAMEQENAVGVRDLTSSTTEEYVLIILLKRYVYHTSAELIKATEPQT